MALTGEVGGIEGLGGGDLCAFDAAFVPAGDPAVEFPCCRLAGVAVMAAATAAAAAAALAAAAAATRAGCGEPSPAEECETLARRGEDGERGEGLGDPDVALPQACFQDTTMDLAISCTSSSGFCLHLPTRTPPPVSFRKSAVIHERGMDAY